jgi:hypothetical protein
MSRIPVLHRENLTDTIIHIHRVLGDAYFGVPVRMFITAGRKKFRARIPRTLNFAWGRIKFQPQIHKFVSACQSLGRRSYAHPPAKRLANQR